MQPNVRPECRLGDWWAPWFSEREAPLVCQVLASGFPNDGDWTTRLEASIANICEVPYAVGVTSGTSALFLALAALGIGPGDEVIVPDITFIATANAVALTGATPVLADVLPNCGTIDPDDVARRITVRTRAILPVHVSGRAADLERLGAIADQHGLFLVEDAAEALGSRKQGKPLGSMGQAGCFSFSPNKTITTGQGGMVVTRDPELHVRLRQLKDQGRPVRGTGGDDQHLTIGYNFKLTNLQAAVGLGQLQTFEKRLDHLRTVYRCYGSGLAGLPGIKLLPFDLAGGECPQWVDVAVDDRDDLVRHLERRGIATRKFWHPLHTQTPYRQPDPNYPVASSLCSRAMWLPSHFFLTPEAIAFVCAEIGGWVSTRTGIPHPRAMAG